MKTKINYLIKEFLWLLIAFLVCAIVQFPIYQKIEYKFLLSNSLIIVASVLYIKSALDFKNLIYLKNKWIRIVFFVVNLFVFISIIPTLQNIIILFDSFTIMSFTDKFVLLSPPTESFLLKYIQNEYLLFSIVTIIGLIIVNILILKSFWNKNYFKKE